jgi:ABC-type sugar transport system substrate-binding protein
VIVSAAVRLKNGLILSLPRPARHHDIIQQAAEAGITDVLTDQGFLTSDGEYVGRKKAKEIATEAGQKFLIHWGHQLFSEDLW